jgi:hypothetical protein
MKSGWIAAALVAFAVACGSSAEKEPSQGAQSGVARAAAPSGNGSPAPADTMDASTGATWSALYRDFFGPTGAASCAGNGTCHGAPDQSGAEGSNGYVCASQDGCRESMLSLVTGVVQASDAQAPEQSTLVTMLRRRTSSGVVGSMPKLSSYVFDSGSIDRIETWIRNGAPND